MDTIIKLAEEQKYNSITLNVNRFNFKAVNAYKKYGFKVKESIDIPYGDFILNDYIMTFSLDTKFDSAPSPIE